MDSVLLRVEEALPNIGRMEESLGRNTPDVQAGAAELGVFFNYRGLQTVLTRTNGRRVSTGTAPDDDHIICHFIFSVALGHRGAAFQAAMPAFMPACLKTPARVGQDGILPA